MHHVVPLSTLLVLAATLPAQSILAPFNVDYSFSDLGSVAGVPANYGGITFLPGNPNVILLCGGANGSSGQVFVVPITRGAGQHITGFGSAILLSTAPNNDGGLCVAPNNVLLFTQYSNNGLGQIKPGSSTPDKFIDLNALGISGSVGTCQIVPAGYPAAGRFKLASYGGSSWYDATLVPDGNGTFDVGPLSAPIYIGGGPEGILFPPAGSPGLIDFGQVLINEYSGGEVSVWNIDGNGDPILGTRQVFMSGLSGVEGATLDPLTNDFLFSTYGSGSRIIQVRGFGTCGTFTNYGTGGPGTAGLIPAIHGSGCPRVGATVQLDIDTVVPNGLGVLFLGFQQLSVPFLNFTVLNDLSAQVGIQADAAGNVLLNLPIPNSAGLGNLNAYLQAGFLDGGAPNGISASNGLQMFIL